MVKDDKHQSEVYTCLWLLLTETDKEKFLNCLGLFVEYCKEEPKFIENFQGTYSNRPGTSYVMKFVSYLIIVIHVEKWALVFWHFDYQDTDANKFLERLYDTLAVRYL